MDSAQRGAGERLSGALLGLAERGRLPDGLIRFGIRRLVRAGLRERAARGVEAMQADFESLLAECAVAPVAVATADVNAQHYEWPAEFFELCLGRHRKYSGCWWPRGAANLDQAESASLAQICERADLADGQRILELGCGWGSLSLWMAERFPRARIVAVSNSHSQRAYILGRRDARGLANLDVVTADMNGFEPGDTFDRVVSIEMFEHMRNHAELMRRIAAWLRPGGRLFVHIFVHGRTSYLFETGGAANWMGRHFFTGGMMPADHHLPRLQEHLVLEQQWRIDGTHYQRTAEAWLANLDASRGRALKLMAGRVGVRDAGCWLNRWRIFFMACAEMFGYARGQEWWVSHYRFRAR